MRVLLLDAEDSPRRGPWSAQSWDLIVDLGKSSEFSVAEWTKQLHCPVLCANSFRRGVEDLRHVREIFATERGRLIDDEGIDWWELTSLVIAPEAEAILVLGRVAAEIDPAAEVWASRRSWATQVVGRLLRRSIEFFSDSLFERWTARARHYGEFFRRFPAGQIQEIILDRFDSGYQWRSRLSSRPEKLENSVVLLPSAYGNVSRMASSYAALLPEQDFLLVSTRRSAKQFESPANVHVRDLSAYAKGESPAREIGRILDGWQKLSEEMRGDSNLNLLLQSGAMEPLPGWFRDGLHARNAWREVIEHEPVSGVLCGDDSNIFTRLPVLLAARRKIPTVDFHHGAMDGRYLLKDLPCDVYLAKNEMERDYLLRICELATEKVTIGSPPSLRSSPRNDREQPAKNSVVFFSEPYENAGMRTEEVYRELLPLLCRVARENNRRVVIKLHPFESMSVRQKFVYATLAEEDRKLLTIVDGPLSSHLLSSAWFGITVESTTVIDCLLQDVPCFLCGWLTLSSFEYPRQYQRFGVGEILNSAGDIAAIPQRIAKFDGQSAKRSLLSKTLGPDMLRRWLKAGTNAEPAVRRVS